MPVTSVRDIGTWRAFTDVALRYAINAGWVEGPRMMVAGAHITCPGGGGDITGLAVDVDEVVPRELRFGVTSGIEGIRINVRQLQNPLGVMKGGKWVVTPQSSFQTP